MHSSHAEPARLLEFKTEPTTDTYGTQVRLDRGLVVSYVFQRPVEDAKNEDAMAWRMDPRGLYSFAVCDGVSQSYYGYIASNFLAKSLVQHLADWTTDPRLKDFSASQDIRGELDSWVLEGQKVVERHQMARRQQAGATHPVLREQMKRRLLLGSQTVFFAGCIDCRPVSTARSLFVWMGNVQGQVFSRTEQSLLDASSMVDDQNRWTTARGCRGELQVKRIATDQISRVLATSDGLNEVRHELDELDGTRDERMIQMLRGREFADDVSLLSVEVPSRHAPRPRRTQLRLTVVLAIMSLFVLVAAGMAVRKATSQT